MSCYSLILQESSLYEDYKEVAAVRSMFVVVNSLGTLTTSTNMPWHLQNFVELGSTCPITAPKNTIGRRFHVYLESIGYSDETDLKPQGKFTSNISRSYSGDKRTFTLKTWKGKKRKYQLVNYPSLWIVQTMSLKG